MSSMVRTFIEALNRLEDTGDADPITALFKDEATVSNPLVLHEGQGREAARAFWLAYREAFQSIRSEFRHIIDSDGVAFLEWVSIGATREGPFRYGGVSVIEHREGKITGFRSYFDPAHLHAHDGETRRHVGHESPLVAAQKDDAEDRAKNGGYQ